MKNGTETRIESKCMSDIPSQAGFVENKAAYMLFTVDSIHKKNTKYKKNKVYYLKSLWLKLSKPTQNAINGPAI